MEDKKYFHMYEEEEHHWWYVGMRFIVSSLLSSYRLPSNPLVLDAGCGTGYNMGWFRRYYGARVAGIDYSMLGLEFCRRRGENMLARADAAMLPLSSGMFNLVVSLDVLTHLDDKAARCRAPKEFWRVLKPEGLLLLRVAAHEWLRRSHDESIKTGHRCQKKELLEEAEAAGFRALRMTCANSIPFPGAVVWRM